MTYKDLYLQKNRGYFVGNARYEIIKQIPNNKHNKVLELGCGDGATLLELKKINKASFVAGIDIMDFQQDNYLDKFTLADIEVIDDLPFPKEYFDVIICADVLEHLKDPWEATKKVVWYLKKDGIFIASIPNIREIKTLYDLIINNDFKYVEAGILDKTHLRFFCKKNMIDLFNSSDLKIKNILRIPNTLSKKRILLNFISFGLFREFFVTQYLIIGIKK